MINVSHMCDLVEHVENKPAEMMGLWLPPCNPHLVCFTLFFLHGAWWFPNKIRKLERKLHKKVLTHYMKNCIVQSLIDDFLQVLQLKLRSTYSYQVSYLSTQ